MGPAIEQMLCLERCKLPRPGFLYKSVGYREQDNLIGADEEARTYPARSGVLNSGRFENEAVNSFCCTLQDSSENATFRTHRTSRKRQCATLRRVCDTPHSVIGV